MIHFALDATGSVVDTVQRGLGSSFRFDRGTAGKFMGLFNRVFAGQRIDEWASDYTLVAARTLNQVAADLIVSVEGDRQGQPERRAV